MTPRRTRRNMVSLLILVLLLTQGLRVCLHFCVDLTHPNHGDEVASLHLESTLNTLNGNDELGSDQHVELFGLLSMLSINLLIGAIFCFALLVLLLPSRRLISVALAQAFIPCPAFVPYSTPLLRAPPR